LQNVYENLFLAEIILENQKDFNILFIQELLWSVVRSILSTILANGDKLVGIPNHLSWITFVRNLYKCNKHPRVLMYINARLIFLSFSFRKEIYNHKDINLVSFTNSSSILDIYPDNHQLALKYLKDTEADLNNVIIMSSDFNIRNSDWNPSFPHHLMHANHLLEIADLLNLERLLSINLVPNRYTDNPNNSNSVIVLIFLRGYSEEFNTHLILPDMRGLFDYSPLIINIVIQEELIQ